MLFRSRMSTGRASLACEMLDFILSMFKFMLYNIFVICLSCFYSRYESSKMFTVTINFYIGNKFVFSFIVERFTDSSISRAVVLIYNSCISTLCMLRDESTIFGAIIPVIIYSVYGEDFFIPITYSPVIEISKRVSP